MLFTLRLIPQTFLCLCEHIKISKQKLYFRTFGYIFWDFETLLGRRKTTFMEIPSRSNSGTGIRLSLAATMQCFPQLDSNPIRAADVTQVKTLTSIRAKDGMICLRIRKSLSNGADCLTVMFVNMSFTFLELLSAIFLTTVYVLRNKNMDKFTNNFSNQSIYYMFALAIISGIIIVAFISCIADDLFIDQSDRRRFICRPIRSHVQQES